LSSTLIGKSPSIGQTLQLGAQIARPFAAHVHGKPAHCALSVTPSLSSSTPLQVSVVQSGMLVPTHVPEAQTSLLEQTLPSSHFCPFGAASCVQPEAALHPSIVHALPSSQLTAMLAHPSKLLQESVVQALASSHVVTGPGTQAAALQESPTVHASPSVQGEPSVAARCTHFAFLQISVLQGLPSSHSASKAQL
jgi:hypothetical protein